MSLYNAVSPTSRFLSNVKSLIGNPRQDRKVTPNKSKNTPLSDLDYNFKLRHIATPAGALATASQELNLLADLLDAHFVKNFDEKAQSEAISLATQLASQLKAEQTAVDVQQLIRVDFDRLSRLLLSLKQNELITKSNILWTDIMRPSVRVISLALQKYTKLESRHAEKESELGAKESLNITYSAAQKQLLTDMH